jgi:hypothetical protein
VNAPIEFRFLRAFVSSCEPPGFPRARRPGLGWSFSLSLSLSVSQSDFPAFPAPTALGSPFTPRFGDSRLVPLQAFDSDTDSDSDSDSDSGNAGPRGLAGRPRRGASVIR